MSKNQNLQDFFKKNQKKKPAQQAKQAPTASQAQLAETMQEAKPNEAATQAPLAKAPKKQDDYESDDEERTDLTLGDSAVAIVNKQDVEAQERKKRQAEEEKEGKGWRLEPSANDNFTTSQLAPAKGPLGAQPKGASDSKGGEIKFSAKGPPKFNNKKNMKKIDEDFPEMDAEQVTKNKNSNPLGLGGDEQRSKKDMADIGMFGAASRQAQEPRAERQEERKEATKPMFTNSRKKTFLGGDNVESIQNSKQNYDFGTMRMAAASSKTANKGERKEQQEEDGDEEAKEKRGPREQPQRKPAEPVPVEDDSDFQTVTDTRKRRR